MLPSLPPPPTNIFCLYHPHFKRYFCKALMSPPPQHTTHFKPFYCYPLSPDLPPRPKISSYHFLHFPFVFIRVPFVFTRVHTCSIRVHSCSIRVHSCSTRVHSCSIRVPFVFTRVHSCSLVFSSFVFIRVPFMF